MIEDSLELKCGFYTKIGKPDYIGRIEDYHSKNDIILISLVNSNYLNNEKNLNKLIFGVTRSLQTFIVLGSFYSELSKKYLKFIETNPRQNLKIKFENNLVSLSKYEDLYEIVKKLILLS